MAKTFEEKLCAILVKSNVISQEDAQALQKDFEDRSKETFDDFLLDEGFVQKEELLQALSHYYKVPAFDVVGHFFNRDLLLLFPDDFLIRHAVIPLERDEDIFVFVVSEPDNEAMAEELMEYISDEIQFNVGIRRDIVDAVEEYYDESPFTVNDSRIDADKRDKLYEEGVSIDSILGDDD